MVRVLPLPEGGMMINGHPDRKASSSRVAKNDSNRSGSSLTGDYDHDNGFGSNETGSAQRVRGGDVREIHTPVCAGRCFLVIFDRSERKQN